jgi:hypothetical protein
MRQPQIRRHFSTLPSPFGHTEIDTATSSHQTTRTPPDS